MPAMVLYTLFHLQVQMYLLVQSCFSFKQNEILRRLLLNVLIQRNNKSRFNFFFEKKGFSHYMLRNTEMPKNIAYIILKYINNKLDWKGKSWTVFHLVIKVKTSCSFVPCYSIGLFFLAELYA